MSVMRFLLAGVIVGSSAFNDGTRLNDKNLVTSSSGVIDTNAYNVTSAMLCLACMLLLGIAPTVAFMHSYAAILKEDVASGLLRTVSCWISVIIFDIPLCLLGAVLMSVCLYIMVDLQGHMYDFFATTIVAMLAGYSLAAVCAVWLPTPQVATAVFTVAGTFFIAVAGYFRYVGDIPSVLYWATSISLGRWTFEPLMLAAFSDATYGAEYLDMFGFGSGSTAYSLLCLGWWIGLCQACVYAGFLPPIYHMVFVRRISADAQREAIESEFSQAGPLTSLLHAQSLIYSTSAQLFHRGTLLRNAPPPAASSPSSSSPYLPSSSDPNGKRSAFRKVDISSILRTTLSFSRLRYATDDSDDAADVIVQGVSGIVCPGETLCILDGNEEGAGGILLKVLAGRAEGVGTLNGVLKANGVRLGRRSSAALLHSAFVHRGDNAHLAYLTVRETLVYAAILRRPDREQTCAPLMHYLRRKMHIIMGSRGDGHGDGDHDHYVNFSMTDGLPMDVEERVSEVLLMMGLDDVSHVIIGSESSRNISRSQLRCLTIAVELVNRPSVVFIEDPTAGLDWFHAEIVADAIRALARGGRTVICTLNKPTRKVFEMFDKTLLLGSGHMIYFGESALASAYFDNIGQHEHNDE